MRVLMISTDRNILDSTSQVAKRMTEYGTIFDELHIIVFSLENSALSYTELSPNVFVYPTNSRGRLSYISDAKFIGKEILSNIFFGETAITCQDPFETALVGISLKNKFKFPLQIQLHTDLHSRHFFEGSLLNWIRFIMSRFTLKRADGVRVVRQVIKQSVISKNKLLESKIVTLPIFVDIKKIQDKPVGTNLKIKYSKWNEIVLVASRLTSEKNISLAIRAFSKLVAHNPTVGLVVVGEGAEESTLKHLVKKLKIENNVVFEAWQSDLSSYFKTASLFINTSNFEGYGMTLVEAGASGCPVLTTNVGIAQDFFDDGRNAFVCPVGDEDCIANKLITFFGNSNIQKHLKDEISRDIGKLAISHDDYLQKYKESFNFLFKT